MPQIKQKIIIRKVIARLKRMLKKTSTENRLNIINAISYNKDLLNNPNITISKEYLPTIGKLRLIIEKDLNNEQNRFNNDSNQSDLDLKRLALKSAFFEYYRDLECNPDTVIVDYENDMTLRRDNQKKDSTDFDFAPNKNEIYRRWMDKLNRYVREGRLAPYEYDEAIDRGIPQGGAFEKQLDRYRKDIMQQLWQDYYKQIQ